MAAGSGNNFSASMNLSNVRSRQPVRSFSISQNLSGSRSISARGRPADGQAKVVTIVGQLGRLLSIFTNESSLEDSLAEQANSKAQLLSEIQQIERDQDQLKMFWEHLSNFFKHFTIESLGKLQIYGDMQAAIEAETTLEWKDLVEFVQSNLDQRFHPLFVDSSQEPVQPIPESAVKSNSSGSISGESTGSSSGESGEYTESSSESGESVSDSDEQVGIGEEGHNWLSALINSSYDNEAMGDEQVKELEEWRIAMQNWIPGAIGNTRPQVDLQLHGSRVSGFASCNSTVDACCFGLTRFPEELVEMREQKHWLYRMYGFMTKVEPKCFTSCDSCNDWPRAMLKFYDVRSDYYVNMTVEDPLAIERTKLFRLYSQFDKRAKVLVFLVKQWAKRLKLINEASGFSGYILTLFVIHFLQQQGILPVLHEEGTDTDRLRIVVRNCQISYLADESLVNNLKSHFVGNNMSVSQLFQEFCNYYESMATGYVVQIRSKALVNVESLQFGARRGLMHVEDPLENSLNLCQKVTSAEHTKFLLSLKFASQRIEEFIGQFDLAAQEHQDFSSLLDALLPPEGSTSCVNLDNP